MLTLMICAVVAPACAAVINLICGWGRFAGLTTIVSALTMFICALLLTQTNATTAPYTFLHGLLRADAMSTTMLIVIGTVGTLSGSAGIGYLNADIHNGHVDPLQARLYGALVPAFLSAMALAVCANNIGVIWVAIEATTIVTAFLVGHHRTRESLEATWKYVVICSVGIAIAFLGTILLYFAAHHGGALGAQALDLDVLRQHAHELDRRVVRLAGGLLLIGYGAKAGLFPFHTWLPDAHSQAPAPVSALMSGVLLSVAFSALLRMKTIIDAAVGTYYLRTGLFCVGLITLAIASLMLTVTSDLKRMLAYSSMENMGLIAIAAGAGTAIAITALLFHVLAHGIAKTVLFIASGQLQAAHNSTAIKEIHAVLIRSRFIGTAFAIGIITLLGLPPCAMFVSELAMSRSLVQAGFSGLLTVAMLLVGIAFAALARNTGQLLLGTPHEHSPRIYTPLSVGIPLIIGVSAAIVLGIIAGPLGDLLSTAAIQIGSLR